jgi:hypothetical protein
LLLDSAPGLPTWLVSGRDEPASIPALCAALHRAGWEIVETRTTLGVLKYGTVENLVETEIRGRRSRTG